MDKEIEKGVAELTEDRFRSPAEGAGLNWDVGFNRMLARDILIYLKSKGVVIKVDRKTPKVSDEHSYYELCAQADMLDAGYVAVEDLI